jgi:two-component system sensor histidine kinase YesM
MNKRKKRAKRFAMPSILTAALLSAAAAALICGLILQSVLALFFGAALAFAALVLLLAAVLLPLAMVERSIDAYERQEIDYPRLKERIRSYLLGDLLQFVQRDLEREKTIEIMDKQAEIMYLQKQINPHFLYNALDSIRGHAIVQGDTGTAAMTEALATFFRYKVNERGGLVSLEAELANVNNYYVIQQYRFNNKFTIRYAAEDDVAFSDYYLPKLTLQPIVENAVYHGLETRVGKGEILIRIVVMQERLVIHIADDGVGMTREQLDALQEKLRRSHVAEGEKDSRTGIALVNVNNRLRLLFGRQYGLYITSTPNIGTDVEVSLPVIGAEAAKQYSRELLS